MLIFYDINDVFCYFSFRSFNFVGLTAYDTQKIKNMYAASDTGELMGKKAVMGALTLYLDFINLFIMLLRLLDKEDNSLKFSN